MSSQINKPFDNEDRTRYYGLRKGDTVSIEYAGVGAIEKAQAVVHEYGFLDNNRVMLKFENGDVRPWVAEHCTIITKVEDK